ncbi:protease complex subunit PrcB family protein [Dethiobacter alkaliphilus]|uniref:protease complex subunit PrcB family protein n=1 Tax=Dethiobacter alkaliphilus TaxID=427926 RepID=UPI0022261C8C|nr:protease complex subunit PrcB family protein [Dethiobacter alkaliphilus]MCW3490917.1 protease complex subunit PrcB family protein [Dethiobacter alkaliphilus]
MNTNSIILGSQIRVPKVVMDWAESTKYQSGVFATTHAGQNVYLLAAGPCPSGGYRVTAKPAPQLPDTVEYKIEGPKNDEMVIQILTYPYELVFSSKPLQFVRLENNKRQVVEPQQKPPLPSR